jgi:hypothetical protein
MPVDRERLALAILNSDRNAGGWPSVGSRSNIPDSEGYVRNVDAILADITEQGLVIVPRVPSAAMCAAGAEPWSEHDDTHEAVCEIWSAMIAAEVGE